MIGILFGKMAKKKLFSNKPWPKGLPTHKNFIVAEEKEFAIEKEKLVNCITHFAKEGYTVMACVHPFLVRCRRRSGRCLGISI